MQLKSLQFRQNSVNDLGIFCLLPASLRGLFSLQRCAFVLGSRTSASVSAAMADTPFHVRGGERAVLEAAPAPVFAYPQEELLWAFEHVVDVE